MKVGDYNIGRSKVELVNMLTDIQDILNLGLYGGTVVSTVPTAIASAGESKLFYSGADYRLYYYINDGWRYIHLNNRVELAGWSYIAEAASPVVTQSQAFGATFAVAPLVFVSYIGSRLISAGTPTGPAWFTGALTLRMAAGYATSTTECTVAIENTSGGNLDATYNSGYVWRALSI